MKILKLKFKNINSLVGESEIDFTNPIFKNDGLFAITGKTGAGKSSILDAISLALYGKTPRVEITGKENAVLTRGEKDCYAEVTFEVAGKKWKSSWKQELNRNGNLNPVRRQVADFDDRIIADQVRTCDTEIVKIIGLTFEQFTKVIMLAQGSFAAFLQADKNSKGELLEQITGTEIYGEISKKVFERNRSEKDKLDKILLQLDEIKILTDEEIKHLTDEIATIKNDKDQIDKELLKIETAKKWLDELTELQAQIQSTKQILPELEQRTKTAKEKLDESLKNLDSANIELEKQQPIFLKVRELDLKIAEIHNDLEPVLNKISELNESKKEVAIRLRDTSLLLKETENSRIELQEWTTKNQIYEELVTNFTAIEREDQILKTSAFEIQKLNDEINRLKIDFESKQNILTSATESFDENEQKFNEKSEELESKKANFLEILDGSELTQLQSEREKIKDFGLNIRDLLAIEKAISANQAEISKQNNRLNQIEIAKNELIESIRTNSESNKNIKDKIELLEENIKLTQRIRNLDDHRKHLKDGEECPLCGSLEHPFALGNIPQLGEKEKNLAEMKKQNEELLNTLQKSEKALSSLQSEQNNILFNKEKEDNLLKSNFAKQSEILLEMKQINPDFSVSNEKNRIEILDNILIGKREEHKNIDERIKKAEKINLEIAKLRDVEIPNLQTTKSKAEGQRHEAKRTRDLAGQQLADRQKSAHERNEKFNIENDSFLKKLKRYDTDNILSLKNNLNTWNEKVQLKEKLSKESTTLNNETALNQQEINSINKSLEEKQIEKEEKKSKLDDLTTERKEIFGEKSVQEEENSLKNKIAHFEKTKEEAEAIKITTNTEFEKSKAIIKDKETILLQKQEQKISEKTIEELLSEFDKLKLESEHYLQKIGAKKQTLVVNSENLKRSGDKLKEKDDQQEICKKWGKLNYLIGSADGKAYRNFAQALTFEHLIGLANRQLHKMSDRYILKRTDDKTNPFDLFVIDKYQNSDLRTAQNLSGGEKFIVSLSLALGLANMASKNMQIDTMFIDEGFGTLDSDYLDLALNALSNLQSEGKIIGVISHLTQLKERIATHIEVVPSGNGYSKIQVTN